MYITLVKLFIKENFSFKRLLGFDYKKSKLKTGLISVAILYALLVFVLSFGYMFFDLGRILKQMDQIHIMLSFLAIYGLGLSLILVFFRSNGMLFKYKDYEILAPLPITHKTLLLAKLTVLLLMMYFSIFLFTSPIVFSYFYHKGFNGLSFLYFFIAYVFMPIIPMIIMSFFALFITSISARFRRSNLINIGLMFAFFLGIMAFSFNLNEATINPLTGQIELFKGLTNWYMPIQWFNRAVNQQSLLDVLWIVLTHGIAFFLYWLVLDRVTLKTNQRQTSMKFGKATPTTYQSHSLFSALVLKEFRKFLSVPLYALNAGLGVVILLALALGSLFYGSQIEDFLAQMLAVDLQTEMFLLVVIGFSIAMTYTPAISLSLEGKNFWIVKSLPIKSHTLMFSKVLFNVHLVGWVSLLSVVLLGYALKISGLHLMIIAILSMTFTLSISLMDGVINLYLPKFDFKNEVEVIKQSIGALLGVFGGFFLMLLSGFAYYYLNKVVILSVTLSLLVILNGLLALLFAYILYSQSDKQFKKMQA